MNDASRLGIISDTHLVDIAAAHDLAEQLVDGPFAEVDAILHAGDMVLPEFEFCFGAVPVYSVQGNMDPADCGFPPKRILIFGSYRVGLIHGWGAPGRVAEHAFSAFVDEDLDLIIYGHSHRPWLEQRGKTLLFNPGSAVDHRNQAPACSVGLVELGEQIRARHIYL